MDIAGNDSALGLPERAQIVALAIGGQPGVVLVAQSLAGFTAPMVSQPAAVIVLPNAMIPEPGKTSGEWWDTTGSGKARRAAAEERCLTDSDFDGALTDLFGLQLSLGECARLTAIRAGSRLAATGGRR